MTYVNSVNQGSVDAAVGSKLGEVELGATMSCRIRHHRPARAVAGRVCGYGISAPASVTTTTRPNAATKRHPFHARAQEHDSRSEFEVKRTRRIAMMRKVGSRGRRREGDLYRG